MKVAIYTRTRKAGLEVDDPSVPSQLARVRDWCRRHNIAIMAEYEEMTERGSSSQKPILQQMMANACLPNSPYEAIVVEDLSRISRDFKEFAAIRGALDSFGVRILPLTKE